MQLRAINHVYTVRISDGPILNEAGLECWGLCQPATKTILLAYDLPLDEREQTLRHEYCHACQRQMPGAVNEESQATFFAMASEQFQFEFEQAGGSRALMALRPPGGDAARALLRNRLAQPTVAIRDRIECPCSATIMCGSIVTDPAEFRDDIQVWSVRRGACCPACGGVFVWHEQCHPITGYPLGTFLQSPAPRVLSGQEAREFLRHHPR